MIGLVDYDFQSQVDYTHLIPPNLEIMKLAAYFKMEEKQFCRLVDLNEGNLNSYDKIYFFSEKTLPPEIPCNFLSAYNVEYGGTAFTNGVYKPFKNEIIDFTLPRINIYHEFLSKMYKNGAKGADIEHILDDSYYRMYAGKNKLPLPPMQHRKRLFLYDTEFFYDDWESTIEEIVKRKPSSIVRIHPIICKKLSQYWALRKCQKVARSNIIILDVPIPLDDVQYLLKNYTNLFLADITASTPVYLALGTTFKSEQQYYNDFIYKMNLLFAFWSKEIPIKLYYIQPLLGTKDPLAHLSIAAEKWSQKFNNKSLNEDMIKKSTPKKIKPLHVQERDRLIALHPSAKDLFEQSFPNIVSRGLWNV